MGKAEAFGEAHRGDDNCLSCKSAVLQSEDVTREMECADLPSAHLGAVCRSVPLRIEPLLHGVEQILVLPKSSEASAGC